MDGRIVICNILDYHFRSQCSKRNAFWNVRGSAGMAASYVCLLEYESVYHKLYRRWSCEDLWVGYLCYAATDGDLLSYVYAAGGFWVSAADCFQSGWLLSKGLYLRKTGADDVYGVWVQCSRGKRCTHYRQSARASDCNYHKYLCAL